LGKWLAEIPDEEIRSSARLSLLSAWCSFDEGERGRCERWAATAEGHLDAGRFPSDASVHATLMLLRAARAEDVQRMLEQATIACDHESARTPARAMAYLLSGTALRLLGRTEQARNHLEDGLRVSLVTAPAIETLCRTQLAILAIGTGEAREAERQVRYAMEVIAERHLALRPVLAETFSIAALVDARAGATRQGLWEAKWARTLLASLDGLVPWIAVEARVLVAEASIEFGLIGQANELLEEARGLAQTYGDFGALSSRLDRVQQRLHEIEMPLGIIASPLTPAEVRVLRHLPTHLTYAEIAEQLFVSRNTVKTQAISAYRKLGVTSRREAVERSRSLGLIH
jgi:LuxR family maltose regulon positive regulatory protein